MNDELNGVTMRKDPTTAELMEHEVETEAHQLVLEWQQERSEWFKRDICEIVVGFAEWLLQRRPPPGNALQQLAERLTPNPALTSAGTLAIILDGIDKIDEQQLARSLAFVNARDTQGMAVAPITDEQWRDGDIKSKMHLLTSARNLKAALRECGNVPGPTASA